MTCEIDASDAAALRSNGNVAPERVSVFQQIGALTDNPEAQLALALMAYENERNSIRELTLVIPLTSACNLNCSYCYQAIHGDFQGPRARRLAEWNDASIGSLQGFVYNQLRRREYGTLKIKWYGGEPLLRLDLLESMGNSFQKVASRLERRLTGQVVTNGTLLSGKAVKLLKRLNVERLEISIDGPKENHDALRASKSGASTYDTVLRSIVKCSRQFATIVFRVNIHSTNAPFIEDWIVELGPTLREYESIYFKFKLVEGDRANQLPYEEFARWSFKYSLAAKSVGLRCIQQNLETETCPAIGENYYIVQSDLKVFKCPQNLGSDDNVGVLNPDGAFEPTASLQAWAQHEVSSSDGCVTCAHLPHCNGGCPYNEIMKGINEQSLQTYERRERCCREKLVPLQLLARLT